VQNAAWTGPKVKLIKAPTKYQKTQKKNLGMKKKKPELNWNMRTGTWRRQLITHGGGGAYTPRRKNKESSQREAKKEMRKGNAQSIIPLQRNG